MLVKLTVQAQPDAIGQAKAIAAVKFVAGGLVKAEGEKLLHYTEHEALAKREWQERGFRIVSSEEVELAKERFARLIGDLEKLQ